ncbi:MAG: tRNA lysidine(34) synthetase TilS, partial [Pseudomonadota bacterium]
MSAEKAPPAGRSKDAAPPPPTASAADLAEAAALSDRLRPRLERLLAGEPAVAVAVSGGRDSLALLILTAAFARGRAEPLRVAALSVDHGLRDGSRAEAESVAGHAAALGAESALLVWEEREERSGNLQAAARAARYRLMRAWRRAHGVGPLLTAHHREDVAETFLLRLARGSGVDGLAGMAEETIEEAHDDPSAERPGPRLRLIRPLLETPGAALGAVCRAAGRAWIEDPSNADPRFDRARARALAEPLAALGLDAPRLANTARAMARARTALEEGTAALLATAAAREEALGLCRLALPPLARAPRELQLRALRACLRWVAAAPYPPRLDALEAALDALLAAPAARTLGGCQIAPDGAEAAV